MIRRALLYTLIPACFVLAGAQAPPQAPAPAPTPIIGLDGKPDTLPDAAFVDTVRKHCSKCHVAPEPRYVPRGMWRLRIQEMAQRSLMGTGLAPNDESALWQMDTSQFVRYFEARAPITLPLPEPWPEGDGGLRLKRTSLSPPGETRTPVTANVRLFDLDKDARPEVVACDMGHGVVMLGEPLRSPGALRVIASIPNPAHSEMVDLDKDGKQDLIVADLGDFLPGDHEKGSVVWLRTAEGWELQSRKTLASRLGRVADVQAADFDGDGDLDLVVAVFGWRTRRRDLRAARTRRTDWKQPKFEALRRGRAAGRHPRADRRPERGRQARLRGARLAAVRARGRLHQPRRGQGLPSGDAVPRGRPPSGARRGSSWSTSTRDGDLDLLMTNGDSLDDFTVRPFHGVRWLENQGSYPWTQHDLAAMPGVHRAQAADIDGDGDLDVVATAFLPNAEHPAFQLLERQGSLAPFTGLGWIEQVKPGVFVPHPIEEGKLTHTTLDLGDVDGDGDVDIATGNFVGFTFAKSDTGFKAEGSVDLWINQRKP